MTSQIAIRAMVVWAGILVLAIGNGIIREYLLLPRLGNPTSLLLSGSLLSVLILVVVYLSLPWLHLRRRHQLWLIGFGWLALTLAFEATFGVLQGKSWSELARAYTFADGNLWPLVLVVLATAPYIAGKLRNII
ncbi:hypothetical protein [Marinobacter sp. C2H3]|uniref:hypothetical protein n=1 Tax=Marinobacter sp. C2H3 TaxID=3119003 RepID=UPI00300E73CE